MRAARLAACVALLAPALARAGDGTDDQVTLEGYLETYYALSFALPSNQQTNLRGYDDHDRTFALSNVALGAKAERGALTATAILQTGAWGYVQQATLAYAAPHDLTIQAGLFPSPIGPEVVAVKDNWNWSRSDLFFGLPFYHTGVVVSRPLGDGWTAAAHVYNGWNSVVDNNDRPSVGASLAYASQRVPAAQVMYFGGDERPTGAPEGSPWRHLLDAYAQVAITDTVAVMAHGDGGFERNRFGTSGWLAGALYAKVAVTPRIYGAVRADAVREWVAADAAGRASAIFWPTSWIGSFTATLALQPRDGLSVRLELRHDQAASPAFYGGDVAGNGTTVPYVPDRRSRDTLTLGATAWF